MTSISLFRNIWRVNAVLILLVGLIVLGFATWQIGQSALRTREKDGIASSAGLPGETNATWRLGSFEEGRGAEYTVAPVYSRQELSGGLRSKEANAVRNYLFINLNDKTSHWLLPNQKRVILSKEDVCVEADHSYGCAAVKWLQYKSVVKDTDGDGLLSAWDKMTLSFSDADGAHFEDVLSDVTEIKSVIQRTVDKRIVIYSSGGKSLITEIDIPSRHVLGTKELPDIGK